MKKIVIKTGVKAGNGLIGSGTQELAVSGYLIGSN